MTKEELISRIKKLQAMALSTNPNEAAQALSRIQKLMQTYNLEASDLDDDSDIGEMRLCLPTGLKDVNIAGKIGLILEKAMGVQSILYKKSASSLSHIVIIGQDAVLKSCEYVYTMLCRYVLNAKKEYDKIVWYDLLRLLLTIEFNRMQLKTNNSRFYKNCIEKQLDPCIKEQGLYEIFYKEKEHDENDPRIKQSKYFISEIFKKALYADSGNYQTLMLKKELADLASKNRRAFVNGYLISISRKIEEYALTEKEAFDIENYTRKNYQDLKIRVKRRTGVQSSVQMNAFDSGIKEGKKASFKQAVENHTPERARIGKK